MVTEYMPHAAQMEIPGARGFRFRTVCTGRRFGKTMRMAAELPDRGGEGRECRGPVTAASAGGGETGVIGVT